MNKIIYQQSFTDPAYHPLGSRSIRVMVFSDGLVQFCEAEDDDLLCSCTINDISNLAEIYTEKIITEGGEKESVNAGDAKEKWPCNCQFFGKENCGVHGPGRERP